MRISMKIIVILTKLVLGLNWFVGLYVGSTAHPVSGTDSEQVHGVLVESCHCVLRTLSVVCGQRPGLTLHITSLHHIGDDLAATITLWLLPCQADFAISCVDHLQVLHGSRDIYKDILVT